MQMSGNNLQALVGVVAEAVLVVTSGQADRCQSKHQYYANELSQSHNWPNKQ